MPKNPDKTRCHHPGCRAWARRGSLYCAAHDGQADGDEAPPMQALPGAGSLTEYTAPDRDTQLAYLMALRGLLDQCIAVGMLTPATVSYVQLVTRITQTILRNIDAGDGDDALDRTIRDITQELEAACNPISAAETN